MSYIITFMHNSTVISMREIQRNYTNLIKMARRRGKPLILGSHGKAQAVLMDIGTFQRISQGSDKHKRVVWSQASELLDRISKKGKQDISLSDFILNDRKAP